MQTLREYRTLHRLHPDHAKQEWRSEDESGGVAFWAVLVLAAVFFGSGLWAVMA